MQEQTQLTHEQAVAFYDSGAWADMTARQLVDLQMQNEYLCIPFSLFHKSMEEVLGRPVWTHEFAYQDQLKAELYEGKPTPTMQEILDLIPADKLVIVVGDTKGEDSND